MTLHKTLAITLLTLAQHGMLHAQESTNSLFYTREGRVEFLSDAPLESIEAASSTLQGLLDIDASSFAFSVAIRSFEGFNSPLQQEHFNENYLESDRYPKATFSGRLLDPLDENVSGPQPVRVKGMLDVHGVTVERIIDGSLELTNDHVIVRSLFVVELADHDISIPRIMYQKLASDIRINLEAELTPSP